MVNPFGKGFDLRISLIILIPSDSDLALWLRILKLDIKKIVFVLVWSIQVPTKSTDINRLIQCFIIRVIQSLISYLILQEKKLDF